MKQNIKILLIGDVVGQLGQAIFQKHIDRIKEQYEVDGIVVNGENSHSLGRGITPRIVNFFKHNGTNVITTGNHIWARKEIIPYLTQNNDLLRPANFPSSCPGTGVTTFNCAGVTVGIINLQGRIFMKEHVDCPFKAADSLLLYLKSRTDVIIIDFHAEASSEKIGMGLYLDGRISAIVGTHTHVQTSDERVLPKGTAFITDLGMSGALNSMIGMRKDSVLPSFLTQMPSKFEVDIQPPALLCGVVVEIDSKTGRALSIDRVRIIDEDVHVDSRISD